MRVCKKVFKVGLFLKTFHDLTLSSRYHIGHLDLQVNEVLFVVSVLVNWPSSLGSACTFLDVVALKPLAWFIKYNLPLCVKALNVIVASDN